MGDGNIARCMDRWKVFTQMTLDSLEQTPTTNYLLVNYEELISNFDETMNTILKFYSIDLPDDSITTGEGEQFRRAPIKNNFNKWQRELSKKEITYFENTCGEIMAKLGCRN